MIQRSISCLVTEAKKIIQIFWEDWIWQRIGGMLMGFGETWPEIGIDAVVSGRELRNGRNLNSLWWRVVENLCVVVEWVGWVIGVLLSSRTGVLSIDVPCTAFGLTDMAI